MSQKMWGKHEFWGLGGEFDIDWVLTEPQIKLRDDLIEICRSKIRPLAVKCDQTYEYPRESLKALAELGLLSLIVPKSLGGLGENHVCLAMVLETLARYGCPSTAMIYSMHIQATAILLFRHHENEESKALLRRINGEVLIGSASYSDPATGGHFWFPLTSKSQKLDDEHYKVFRFNSWTTSAGFADFYVFQTPTPGPKRDHSNLTGFFAYKDEVRASSDNWASLGLHGNQAGPLVIEAVLNKSRMIGQPGDGALNNDEVGAPIFLLCTASVWTGLALGCIDIAKKHVTEKFHGDLGNKVCDYPVIQDYFGRAIIQTNNCRGFTLMVSQQLDKLTNGCDWKRHIDPKFAPRSKYGLWLMQAKHNTAENAWKVSDLMLRACGGDGFKSDLGLERLFRDGRAGCLMGPTNEVVRNLVGKASLLGVTSMDLWNKQPNQNVVRNEINKMTFKEKQALLDTLNEDLVKSKNPDCVNHPFQDTDFDNPFNTEKPAYVEELKSENGKIIKAGLHPNEWNPLTLKVRSSINNKSEKFIFCLPNSSSHLGCLPGQLIQARIKVGERYHERYFSPVSPPDQAGELELAVRFETHGIVSQYFKSLRIGSSIDFRGPCGGFEFDQTKLTECTILASGSGVVPAVQIIRCLSKTDHNQMKCTLIYYAKCIEDFLFKDELEKAAESNSNLQLILTVSDPPEDWKCEEGFINLKMIEKYVTKPNGKKHQILMCGGPGMTIACLHAFKILDFPSDMIYIYGTFGTEQIRAVYGPNAALSSHKC